MTDPSLTTVTSYARPKQTFGMHIKAWRSICFTDWLICSFGVFGRSFREECLKVFELFFGQLLVKFPHDISKKNPLKPFLKKAEPSINPFKGPTKPPSLMK